MTTELFVPSKCIGFYNIFKIPILGKFYSPFLDSKGWFLQKLTLIMLPFHPCKNHLNKHDTKEKSYMIFKPERNTRS